MKSWRLLDTGALPASLNMALDQALLEMHARGESPATLRFYQWSYRRRFLLATFKSGIR